MSKKIIVFIWEWNSEIAFFQEYLKKQYKIEWEKIKTNIIYEINWNFILFSHPQISRDNHRWWNNAFKKSLTYIKINAKIKNHLYVFWNIREYEFIYLFLTDTDDDNSEKKVDWDIESLIKEYCKEFNWVKKVIWSKKIIESWFVSGLWIEFIEKHPDTDKIELRNIMIKDIEKENDVEKTLKNKILKNTSIFWTTQETIWREFWKYIDIEQAKSKSSSFKKFVEEIDNILDN
jgi:hypothetical protein